MPCTSAYEQPTAPVLASARITVPDAYFLPLMAKGVVAVEISAPSSFDIRSQDWGNAGFGDEEAWHTLGGRVWGRSVANRYNFGWNTASDGNYRLFIRSSKHAKLREWLGVGAMLASALS
jgi:hypothetical protein